LGELIRSIAVRYIGREALANRRTDSTACSDQDKGFLDESIASIGANLIE
jgi:hypothetical protein